MPHSASLYIHIPFCTQKCNYCDFYSRTVHRHFVPYHDNPAFIQNILRHIAVFKQRYDISEWKTAYIGGGTPSLLSPRDVAVLAAAICKDQITPVEEFTIEANPEDIFPEWLAACQDNGINRLSVGIQSLNNAVLQASGRRGSSDKTHKAISVIKKHWKGIFACDLIAGLKGQSTEMLIQDAAYLVDCEINHISVYGLCSCSPLTHSQEDLIADMLKKCTAYLSTKEYTQYEVSNFSYQNKYKSIHNEIYWNMKTYIGIGAAAVSTVILENKNGSFVQAERITGNTEKGQPYYRKEYIQKKDFLREVLLMGFRLISGIDRAFFCRRFSFDITNCIGETIHKWEKKGLCILTPRYVALTVDGLFFLNTFLVDCFIELDKKNFFPENNILYRSR